MKDKEDKKEVKKVERAKIAPTKTYILREDYQNGKKLLKKGSKIQVGVIAADFLKSLNKI